MRSKCRHWLYIHRNPCIINDDWVVSEQWSSRSGYVLCTQKQRKQESVSCFPPQRSSRRLAGPMQPTARRLPFQEEIMIQEWWVKSKAIQSLLFFFLSFFIFLFFQSCIRSSVQGSLSALYNHPLSVFLSRGKGRRLFSHSAFFSKRSGHLK